MTDALNIKAFAFDVDGVLTDGGVFCNLEGQLFRTFDAKDGFALRMASMNGYPLAIITGGRSGSIRARVITSGVKPEDVYLGSRDKLADLRDFCRRYSLGLDEVMYFGDDLPDAEALRACGCGVCPSDGTPDAKEAADIVSDYPGGKGCVRYEMERVMRLQGRWSFDTPTYKDRF